MICFFAGGGSLYARFSWVVFWDLDRFEAAAATARKGELATLGMLARGALLFDIVPSGCGDGGIDTKAICNDNGLNEGPGQERRGTGGQLARDVLHVRHLATEL